MLSKILTHKVSFVLLPYSEATWNILSHSLRNQGTPCFMPSPLSVPHSLETGLCQETWLSSSHQNVCESSVPQGHTLHWSIHLSHWCISDFIWEISIFTGASWKYFYSPKRTLIVTRCQVTEMMFGGNTLSWCPPAHPRKPATYLTSHSAGLIWKIESLFTQILSKEVVTLGFTNQNSSKIRCLGKKKLKYF